MDKILDLLKQLFQDKKPVLKPVPVKNKRPFN